MLADPSFIGKVQDVCGATVTVELTPETVTGLSFVNGEGYRIGQVLFGESRRKVGNMV